MLAGRNLFLIGPTGAGKTTIGKLLASSIHKTFYDVDEQIEHRTGVDVPWIFDVEGEAGFRARESQMIDELSQESDVVIATGAGAVLAEENRKILSSRGIVIYLKASLQEQLERTHDERHRPLLAQSSEKSDTLSTMRAERTPFYESLSDFTFDTDGLSVKMVTQEILKVLEKA